MEIITGFPPAARDPQSVSLECERAILGSATIDAGGGPSYLARALAAGLRAEDFTEPGYRATFRAMEALHLRGVPIDLLTVSAEMARQETLGSIGGLAGLANLADDLPDPGRTEFYAETLKDRTARRRLAEFFAKSAAGLRDGASTEDVLASLTREAEAIQRKLATHAEIKSVSARDFLALDLPPRPVLVQGLAFDRDAIGWHGWRGVGKSLSLLHLVAHAAAGRDFAGWKIPEPVGVLYIDGETARQELQRRLGEAVRIAGAPQAPFEFLAADSFPAGIPSLATAEGQAVIARVLAEHPGIRLVILDSVATLCVDPAAPDENSAESWTHSVGPWTLSLRRLGYTVAVVYHDGKGGVQRGTSAREDWLAQVVQITRPDDWTTDQAPRWRFTLTKSRGFYDRDAQPFEATMEPDTWTCRTVDEVRRDSARKAREVKRETRLAEAREIQRRVNDGDSVEVAGGRIGLHRRTAFSRLKLLREHESAKCSPL
jgi:hypothetical protein